MTGRILRQGLAALCVSAALAVPALADGEFTGTLGATSDYKFRGISQSDGGAAVNGGIEYGQDSLTLGIWASSLDYSADPDNNIEIDLYAAYTHELSEKTSLTGKAYYYWYPNAAASNASYVEFLAQLDHDFGKFSANLNAAWTPENSGDTGQAEMIGAGVEVPITDWATISANVGHQWIEDNATYDLPDYGFGDIGVTLAWEAIAFDVRYVGTDVETADCFSGASVCNSKVVATLTLSNSWK